MADEIKTNVMPKQEERAVISSMDSSPVPSGKVIDLSDMGAENDKIGQ